MHDQREMTNELQSSKPRLAPCPRRQHSSTQAVCTHVLVVLHPFPFVYSFQILAEPVQIPRNLIEIVLDSKSVAILLVEG
jgi:hypothetical protein